MYMHMYIKLTCIWTIVSILGYASQEIESVLL